MRYCSVISSDINSRNVYELFLSLYTIQIYYNQDCRGLDSNKKKVVPMISRLACLLSLASSIAFAQNETNMTQNETNMTLSSAIDDVEEKVIAWRRHIHEHPELSNREFETANLVAAHLEDLGFDEIQTGIAHTGVVGT